MSHSIGFIAHMTREYPNLKFKFIKSKGFWVRAKDKTDSIITKRELDAIISMTKRDYPNAFIINSNEEGHKLPDGLLFIACDFNDEAMLSI